MPVIRQRCPCARSARLDAPDRNRATGRRRQPEVVVGRPGRNRRRPDRGRGRASADRCPVSRSVEARTRPRHVLGRRDGQRRHRRPELAQANRSVSRLGPLDGVVAIGSGFVLSRKVPFVTFEDMTVAQALQQDDPVYESLSKSTASAGAPPEANLRTQRNLLRRQRLGGAVRARRLRGGQGQDCRGRLRPQLRVAALAEKDWSVPRFLFVGVDWERKRGAAVVEAFAAVRERHPNATLDLVGDHPDLDAPGSPDTGRSTWAPRPGDGSTATCSPGRPAS